MSTGVPPERRSWFARIVRLLKKGRVAVIIGFALLMVAGTRLDYFYQWETNVYDLRFRLRGERPPRTDVVIAGINSSSFDQQRLASDVAESEAIALMHDNTWPWPRDLHALIIERLFQAGARVVAVDIVFASPRAGDDKLAAVLEKYKDRIVLASIVQGQQFLQPHTELRRALSEGNGIGYATVRPDPVDGVVRVFDFRTSELREFGLDDDTQDLQSFAALAAGKFHGDTVGSGYGIPINYQGKAGIYPPVPVEDTFIKRLFEQGSRYAQGQIFKDKLVFYGPIAEVLHDVHVTPFGVTPGVEIHAQVAASILNKEMLRWASPALRQWMIWGSGILAILAVLLIRNAIWQALAVVAIAAVLCVGTQIAFASGGIIIPIVPSLFCVVATGLFGVVLLFFLEQWEKAQTRKVLDRFVSKRIAAVILKNAEDFQSSRKGERRPVAVVFSDIRGFTTWSESAKPEYLVGQMNEYFNEMVELIEGTPGIEGNAQKFIGDAILAAWGDTHTHGEAEDARRAVAAALLMRSSLKTLNAGWDGREDRRVISIGIGINYGDVVVGEVGHPERREYTVLGDGVNFAARLESATKQFHTDCLVGERAEELTREHFIFRHVDFLKVKGKTKPVNVYTLISDRSVPPPAWIADYHRARALYVDRKFSEAAALFREVKSTIGGEDFLCDMYAERCDLYAMVPPAADWDGSYTMTDK